MKVKNSQEAVEAMKKTAPGAIDAADVAEGAPNAGTRSVAGKSSSGEPFKYAFSTTTAVQEAKEVAGAHEKSVKLQEGTNWSRLPKSAPPTGSTLKDGEKETYQD